MRARVRRDATVVGLLVLALAAGSVAHDLPAGIAAWSAAHPSVPLDHAVLLLAASHLLMMEFGRRRAADLKAEFAHRRAAEAELLREARHDALTGLLNRAALTSELEQAAAAAAAGGPGLAVVLLDLDRFKEVNDTLGHHVGDALLRAVARRLSGVVRADSLAARLGGDEFVLLLPGCTVHEAEQVARRALDAVRLPVHVDGLVLEVDGSFGVARWSTDGPSSAADLLRAADVAMYAAKADHAGVVVHAPAMTDRTVERLTLSGDLRRGIRDGELRVHYQPRVAVPDGRVRGVEALVRWAHPERGLLAPGAFVPVAEQTGLIRQLTDAVLEQALTDCRRWDEQGLGLDVAVNLSAPSLLDSSLPDRVAALLAVHRVPASRLELEVTESAAMRDPDRAVAVLRRLRALGVRLSVDDYGTGHASLAYLTRLPVSALKIDRSFVQTMELDAGDRTIVRSTIDLAHSLGLRVVAEGVETREAWRQLVELGCDEAQGFWLGRPVPAGDIAAQLPVIAAQVGSPTPAARP